MAITTEIPHKTNDQSDANFIQNRVFSQSKRHPYEEVEWDYRTTEITDDNGEAIFRQERVEVPNYYSDLATKILASKYFHGDIDLGTDPTKGGRESSIRQVLDRVCGTIAQWGLEDGYFKNQKEAHLFQEELTWLCLNQYAAFNSPVWFNLGLYQTYGTGKNSGRGNYYWNKASKTVKRASSQYEYPQCSACFIQHVDDSLESIMELAQSEAMLFKFGSGSGTDLSSIRSTREKLSGGGKPSGPLSFLSVYDSVAGVVKSGGKTRRAAKMNTLKDHHPDIEEFIAAKRIEEAKAWALIEQGYDPSYNGEAYGSIRFQNENLSIRVSDAFLEAAEKDKDWWTRRVTDGKPCEKKRASALLDAIAESTHVCGDPGIQYSDTIDHWHTCKGSGPQNCTNPCSEFLFLDNSACNLASLNLMKFTRDGEFDPERFTAACRLLILAQDIIVDRSSYPTEGIAYNSHHFRPLGLGYANLGGLLMSMGLGYDDDDGRALASAITALMTGVAYKTSSQIAGHLQPFDGYRDARCHGIATPAATDNVASMQEVIQRHYNAVQKLPPSCSPALREAALQAWQEAVQAGLEHGYRNAQVTVLAPTGTIGFLMDCDTTGIEPAIALVAYKTLAGGGSLTLPIRTVGLALKTLGYSETSIKKMENYIKEHGTLEDIELESSTLKSGLKLEHQPVFTTAFQSGKGRSTLSYWAHLKMMAAVQPFLSGGISKTVNMPNSATVAEIRQVYLEAWKMGIKGVAIYRDGSKRSAPITTKKDDEGIAKDIQVVTEPYRRLLPDTRPSQTHKFRIGGSKGYVTVGQFEDGTPGEVFIQMSKAGSTVNGLMDTIGVLLSLNLQYGVPLETLVKKFSHVRFEPEGMTRNQDIPMAKSVIDYLARWLGMEYIPGYRERMSPVAQSEADDVHMDRSEISNSPQGDLELNSRQMELLTTSDGNLTCPECGSSKVKVTGTCACCLNCGSSLGCS
jgi:ribonucleoside-diphosphate reductase alpha chain